VSTPFYALVPFLPFPIVGALVASRRPTNPIGWISLAVGLLISAQISKPQILLALCNRG
jgi:hypothetical protein